MLLGLRSFEELRQQRFRELPDVGGVTTMYLWFGALVQCPAFRQFCPSSSTAHVTSILAYPGSYEEVLLTSHIKRQLGIRAVV